MAEPSFVHAVRVAYDTMAVAYAERFRTELAGKPLDRALLAMFAELVLSAGGGPVADLGCGPGHVTAHLHSLGLSAVGVDLSPGMVEVARRAYPDLRFDEGSMTALDFPDSALGGIAAWHSIPNVPPDELPRAFAEFHRVLAPGGHALLAFQVGDEPGHRSQAFGRPVSLDYWLRRPDQVAALLGEARLLVAVQALREPDEGETVQRAYLLARKPANASSF
jgi:ubiquinone/menaquinone biosynthesis C-methylase UbiE